MTFRRTVKLMKFGNYLKLITERLKYKVIRTPSHVNMIATWPIKN